MKVLLAVLGLVITQASSEKLLVTVYYEALCSDSRNFISDQLLPSVKKLEECVQLRMIPFGKAKSINKQSGLFQCQHGPNECRGNMVQDCALQYMQGRSDVERIDYVNCEMQNMSGSFGNLQCVVDAGIDVGSVEYCVSTNQGKELQLDGEYRTNLVNPAFIPTVTLEDWFDQEIQDDSQVDFYGTVCNYLDNPDPCC